jgi:hypothetical protein
MMNILLGSILAAIALSALVVQAQTAIRNLQRNIAFEFLSKPAHLQLERLKGNSLISPKTSQLLQL